MTKVFHNQQDRVLAILEKGPACCGDISLATGIPSPSVSRAAQGLVVKGAVVRIDRNARYATYALAPATRLRSRDGTPVLHGAAYRKAEDDYIAARKGGSRPPDAATSLGLTVTASVAFEKAFRHQTTSCYSGDTSCPKFADDDAHIEALTGVGSFPVMPSRARSRVPA